LGISAQRRTYLALCIANEFVMDSQTAVNYLTRILQDCSELDPDGLAAVVGCIEKQWLVVLSTGTLAPTKQGTRILAEISDVAQVA
jgi:hypothetical protein